jgi:hypothetical protein
LVLTQLAAVAVGILDALEPIPSLEAWITGRSARFQSTKKSLKRFIQTAQQVLQAGSVQLPDRFRVGMAHISKVRPLSAVTHSFTRFLVGVDALFQGSVIDQPGLPHQKIQSLSLLVIRAEQVFVGAQHDLSRFLSFEVMPDNFIRDCPDRADREAPAPRFGQGGTPMRILLAQKARRIPFDLVIQTVRFARVALDKQKYVIEQDFKGFYVHVQFIRLLIEQAAQVVSNFTDQHLSARFGTLHKVVFQQEEAACITPIACVVNRTNVLHHSIFVKYLAYHPSKGAASGFPCRSKPTVLAA